MRIPSLILVSLLSFAPNVHACQELFGRLLTPEDLRPNMIVTVDQPAVQLEEHEIADSLEADLGLDTYLEAMNVRGDIVITGIHFTSFNTVDIDVFRLSDMDFDREGHTVPRPGVSPTRLTYAHHLARGTGESPKFRVIGHVEGDGHVYTRLVLFSSED